MTLAVVERDGGVTFGVKAVPGSSTTRIAGLLGDVLRVQVAAPPERGKANAAICELLAARLDVPVRAVTVAAGTTSPRKQLHVRGLSAAELVRRLALP